MQECYAPQAIFSDPVFGTLQEAEIKAMWEMLCKQAKDFSLTFSPAQALDEEYYTCQWSATYTFSKTGRSVVNNITAYMRLQNGRITEHTDNFDLWNWCKQALGISGLLFGWTPMLQNKVRNSAQKSLEKFMTTQD
jgi:hypothetical protein